MSDSLSIRVFRSIHSHHSLCIEQQFDHQLSSPVNALLIRYIHKTPLPIGAAGGNCQGEGDDARSAARGGDAADVVEQARLGCAITDGQSLATTKTTRREKQKCQRRA